VSQQRVARIYGKSICNFTHQLIIQIPINDIRTISYKLKNTNMTSMRILEVVSVEFKVHRVYASVEILDQIYIKTTKITIM
jgi:hypothetical protein